MIDSYYRAPLQETLIDPVLEGLDRSGLSPIMITFASLLTGLAVLPCLFWGERVLALVLLASSGYLDVLDGSLARHQGQSSAKGAVLDILSDRTVEFAVIMGLCLVDPASRALTCLWMSGSVLLCVTSFLVVGIFEQNSSHKSFHYSPGIMERAEAFAFFAVMIAWPASFAFLAPVFAVLVGLTAAIRVFQFCKQS